ncbi:hypothetical protein KJK34_08290 [Flavobacterium sp. D11R37]|uniref:hypothetical protein n=1 Tax=Flavobacterium coralii TaxID=2838017 RepID=UPI001CA76DF5|nr:hypothetical protein [Flavobacterium coralii]MBY8962747.1 hypothetical protein [Flavobacterium coralii]
MQIKRLKIEIALIILLWISITFSVIFNPHYSLQFILGILGAVTATVSLRYYNKFTIVIVVLILALLSFGLIVVSTVFDIMFGSVSIIPFLLLLMLLLVRYHELKELFTGNDKAVENLSENSNVDFFRKQFKNLSLKQIQSKLDNENIVPDAKIALKELLEEKQTNN